MEFTITFRSENSRTEVEGYREGREPKHKRWFGICGTQSADDNAKGWAYRALAAWALGRAGYYEFNPFYATEREQIKKMIEEHKSEFDEEECAE